MSDANVNEGTPVELFGCEDCPAEPNLAQGKGLAGPLWIVIVAHDETCPWAARFVHPEGTILATEFGVLIHMPGVLT